MTNPTPDAIKKLRAHGKLTQSAAGGLVHTTCRVWQQWEAGDRRMHPAMWELFKIKLSLWSVNHTQLSLNRVRTPATLHPRFVLPADAD